MDEHTRKNMEILRLASWQLLATSSPAAALSLENMKALFVTYDQQVQETFKAAKDALLFAVEKKAAAEWAVEYDQAGAHYLATMTAVADEAFAQYRESVTPSSRPEALPDQATLEHLRCRLTFAKVAASRAQTHAHGLSEALALARR